MKKLALVFAVASFVTFSCNQAPKTEEVATDAATEAVTEAVATVDTAVAAVVDSAAAAAPAGH